MATCPTPPAPAWIKTRCPSVKRARVHHDQVRFGGEFPLFGVEEAEIHFLSPSAVRFQRREGP
ncbi:hypothetical protein, partial [Thiocapsa sp.]|uniref:hypothetical protein n=1 Tax=Thiocapsa sp. TaxID=2024551 RepID=UPI0035941D67